MKLTVTISKTRQSDQDYLQILSDDQTAVNIVLIADEIEVIDHRRKKR